MTNLDLRPPASHPSSAGEPLQAPDATLPEEQAAVRLPQRHESYYTLVWRRFRRSVSGMTGR